MLRVALFTLRLWHARDFSAATNLRFKPQSYMEMERRPKTCYFMVFVTTVLFIAVFLLYTPPIRYYYPKLAGFGPSSPELIRDGSIWGPIGPNWDPPLTNFFVRCAAQKEKLSNSEYNKMYVGRNVEILDPGYTEIKLTDTWSGNRSWFDDFSSKDNLTIVTAYWDLGSFRKGSSQTFTRKTYLTWFKTFAYLTNPLVVFTDSHVFINLTRIHRARFHKKTRIFLVQRNVLWPFELINQIRSVFSQPGYPKHYPNTVIPEYSAAQHAKYAVLAQTARRRYFNTPYYAWLDIGYFRDIVGSKHYFSLNPPADFDSSKVAFNRVFNLKMTQNPRNIFRSNQVWVGGGLSIGVPKVILEFEELYHKAVLHFLKENLMSTDQQIIFSLYSKVGRKALKPSVEIQLYVPKGNGNPWFYLGYLCMKRVQNATT